MDRSSIDFLKQLGAANAATRKLSVRIMTRQQMSALGEVVRFIVRGYIHLLPQDVQRLRERWLVMRQLMDPRMSFQRKKNALTTYHEMLPRLLRPQYLNRAVALSGEQ